MKKVKGGDLSNLLPFDGSEDHFSRPEFLPRGDKSLNELSEDHEVSGRNSKENTEGEHEFHEQSDDDEHIDLRAELEPWRGKRG